MFDAKVDYLGKCFYLITENGRILERSYETIMGHWLAWNILFFLQIKRIHEYKRQLLNILGIIYRYKKMKPKGNYSRGEEGKVCPSCIHIWRQSLCNICAGKIDSKTDNRRWSYNQSWHRNRRLAKGLFYLFLWHVCMIYFLISEMQIMLVVFLPNQEDHPAWWILLISQPVYMSLSDHTMNLIFTSLQHYKRINYSIIFQQYIFYFSCILLKS